MSVSQSKQRVTRAARRGSDQRFRALVQHSSDLITILQADGTISYQSPSAKPVLGHQPEDAIGRSIFVYVHPEDVSIVQSALDDMRRTS